MCSQLYFIEKHFKLWDRVFFVAEQCKRVSTVTHIRMFSSWFRGIKTQFLELPNEVSALTRIPIGHE